MNLFVKHHNLVKAQECDLRKDPKYKKFEKPEYISALNPCDAFFGGCTEVFRLKWETHDDKVMYLGEFTSLYPAVNSFDHPEIIFNAREYDPTWFGPIKCKILPPQKLYIPVLPYPSDKLFFGLCRTCTDRKQRTPCKHNDTQQALIGTWWHNELNTAISVGSEFLKFTKFITFSTQPKTCFGSTL